MRGKLLPSAGDHLPSKAALHSALAGLSCLQTPGGWSRLLPVPPTRALDLHFSPGDAIDMASPAPSILGGWLPLPLACRPLRLGTLFSYTWDPRKCLLCNRDSPVRLSECSQAAEAGSLVAPGLDVRVQDWSGGSRVGDLPDAKPGRNHPIQVSASHSGCWRQSGCSLVWALHVMGHQSICVRTPLPDKNLTAGLAFECPKCHKM